MDIFGIGVLELIFILIIAMIVVGPRDLGKVGRQIGRFLNRLYKSESWRILNDASRTLRNLPNRLAREAALEELDSVRDSIKEASPIGKEPAQELDKPFEAWTPPRAKPADQIAAETSERSTPDSDEDRA